MERLMTDPTRQDAIRKDVDEDGAERRSSVLPMAAKAVRSSAATTGGSHPITEVNGEGQDVGGEQHHNNTKVRGQHIQATEKRFSCPFHKRYPQSPPRSTACVYPGFTKVSYVKEHLFRRHSPTVTCSLCEHQFENQSDFDEHIRSSDQCREAGSLRTDADDILSREQESAMKSASKRGMVEEEKWRHMFAVLFPSHESKIPDPYCEQQSSIVSGPDEALATSSCSTNNIMNRPLSVLPSTNKSVASTNQGVRRHSETSSRPSSSTDPSGSLAKHKRRIQESSPDSEQALKRQQSLNAHRQRERLACPFYRRNQMRRIQIPPTTTSCVLPGFSSISRLKEHLYRHHRQPLHCPLCMTEFVSTSQLEEHLAQFRPCVRSANSPEITGFNREQESLLRSKKRRHDFDSEKKWVDVYKILFPGDVDIPSPYVNSDSHPPLSSNYEELQRFDEFSRQALPRLVREQLDYAIASSPSPLQDLESRLSDIVNSAQERMMHEFRTLTSHLAPPTADDSPGLGPPRSVHTSNGMSGYIATEESFATSSLKESTTERQRESQSSSHQAFEHTFGDVFASESRIMPEGGTSHEYPDSAYGSTGDQIGPGRATNIPSIASSDYPTLGPVTNNDSLSDVMYMGNVVFKNAY